MKKINKELLYPAGKINDITYTDLAELIQKVKTIGIPEEHWSKLSIQSEHDWSGCYYPDDNPGIVVSLEWPDIHKL
jgi:hypothetical protein